MKITDKVKNSITIEDTYKIKLTYALIKKYELEIGKDIPREEYKYVIKDILLYKALYSLNNTFKTKKELYYSLEREYIKVIPNEMEDIRVLHYKILDKVIEYCEKKGYINDRSYVESFLNRKKNHSHYRNELLLISKGIDKELIKEVIISNKEDILAQEDEYIRKFLLKYKDELVENDRRRKIISKLVLRGYSQSRIMKVYDALKRDMDI